MNQKSLVAVLSLLVALDISLSGCASTAASACYVDGTEYTASVNYVTCGIEKATHDAEAHCAKKGRHAQFAGKINDWTNAYNCVK